MVFGLQNKWLPVSGESDEHSSEPLTEAVIDEWKSNVRSSDFSSGDLETQWTKKKGFKVDARVISDAIIGLSDGLTVPFALTAGLSALGDTKVVIYGGLAELVAGAISMELGGYLGAKSEQYVQLSYIPLHLSPQALLNQSNMTTDRESYKATANQTRDLIATTPTSVCTSISAIFEPYDLPCSTVDVFTMHLSESPKLLDFLMHFEHALPEPAGSRALTCALTIALGYFIGGFVPLLPYFFVHNDQVTLGLCWSIAIMVIALFVFGYAKTCFISGWSGRRNVLQGMLGGGQMVVVGSVAAGAAMGLVKAFNHASHTI